MNLTPQFDHAAAAARKAEFREVFWKADEIPPIPLLQQLNDWVIKQNAKRLPKWKFRFAADFAMQIQSKVTRVHAILFEGVALKTENLSARLLIEPKQLRGQVYGLIKFKLFRPEPAIAWQFKPTSWRCGRGCSQDGLLELRQRVIDALHPDRFTQLTPDLMLSSHCLCCGKGLTDPASMARWIGPECWGNASTNIPRIFRAQGDLFATT